MERLTYSIEETAQMLGVGRSKIYDLMRDGSLKTIKMGRRTLIRRSAIEALLLKIERES
jgi:excisionase family DNA binding protein